MSESWRPVVHLVALLMLLTSLAVSPVLAQARAEQVRVKGVPATIYERPKESSDVIVIAQPGTILDVMQRQDDWYWVIVPADSNGTRRIGYVVASAVERLGDTRVLEPGIRGMPARPEAIPTATGTPELPRFFVGVGGGGQFVVPDFTDHVSTTWYRQPGSFVASYTTGSSGAFEASIGVRLAPRLVLTFAYWRTTTTSVASVDAVVPHPFASNPPRSTSASGFSVGRQENDGHLQITYLIPITRRVDLAVYGGPSVFYLRQDLISDLVFRDVYPYETVTIDSVLTTQKSKAIIGVNVGADATLMLWRFVGVGVGARYARGSMNLPSAGQGSIPVDVGGVQVSGGVRLRF